jgi:putative transposase
MKKSRYTEEQNIGILKQSEAGVKTADLCREHGISAATFYGWKQKFGGMDVSEAQRLKAMEDENRRLKLLVAELSTPAWKNEMNFSWASISLRAADADFTRHDEHGTLSQSRENKPEKRHGLDASGVVFRIRACCHEQSLRPRWCARESSARPSLARVRVAPSNGTQSAMEAIATYWLQPSDKRSTLASVQFAFKASAHAKIAARPAPQNA